MVKIGTHNGKFHADEVLGCYLLRMLDRYRDAEIIRTRDPKVLAELDVVLDVGGEYDPARHRYDHHQPEFNDALNEKYKTRLSSVGLVYKHFGREILRKVAGPTFSDDEIDRLYRKVYDEFLEAFDGVDNGISAYPTDIVPAYKKPLDIFAQIGHFNPHWNEDESEANENARFHEAMEFAGSNFIKVVTYYLQAWLPASKMVHDALSTAAQLQDTNSEMSRIVILERSVPWKSHLYEIEAKMSTLFPNHHLYVIYPETANSSWRIQAVPKSSESFESRKALPEAWRGLRDRELDAVSGIDGCIFVHRSGFIGGNATREGAIAMAYKSVLL